MAATRKYLETFDAASYLKQYFQFEDPDTARRTKHTLRFYHNAFQTLPTGVRVLDYGAGPVLMSTISAATKASEIVLADFVENNRTALWQWLDNVPEAFDWSPHFGYVVKELEGKTQEEVKDREKQVRNLVKAVVHCDITQDLPIQRGYDQQYDVVISSLVMEAVSKNHHEYRSNIARLGNLVKPGGTVLYYGVENRAGYYSFKGKTFPNVHVTADFAVSAFENVGFVDVIVGELDPCSSDPNRTYRFISGKRIQ
jgi:2-polyprenyl-3-methyl-5-hydroxy-6-metoxy-1,4-benzoquinol methylase